MLTLERWARPAMPLLPLVLTLHLLMQGQALRLALPRIMTMMKGTGLEDKQMPQLLLEDTEQLPMIGRNPATLTMYCLEETAFCCTLTLHLLMQGQALRLALPGD